MALEPPKETAEGRWRHAKPVSPEASTAHTAACTGLPELCWKTAVWTDPGSTASKTHQEARVWKSRKGPLPQPSAPLSSGPHGRPGQLTGGGGAEGFPRARDPSPDTCPLPQPVQWAMPTSLLGVALHKWREVPGAPPTTKPQTFLPQPTASICPWIVPAAVSRLGIRSPGGLPGPASQLPSPRFLTHQQHP